MPATPPEFLLLGEILRPHGIRGELRMRLLTDYPERINELEQVHLARKPGAKSTTYPVEHLRLHQNYGLLKLKNIGDRTEADVLRGMFVMVRLEDAVPLEDDEYYLYQLIGMQVETETGAALGELTEVIETGANDVYVVAHPVHGDVLLPATDEVVISIDFEQNRMTVRLMDGLLPADPD